MEKYMRCIGKARLLVFILLIFTLINLNYAADKLQIYSPNYFNEQNNIFDSIDYLENEHLSFKFCTEEEAANISFNIFCKDKSEIEKLNLYEYVDKSKGCYFTNYDLENLDCEEFKLEINYNLNNKKKLLKRDFKKQKQSLLINHILEEDYDELSMKDLSYYLIVLNDVEDKNNEKNLEIYETLKNQRSNTNKCWPKSACNFDYTTTILRNLHLSQYSLNTRMLEDGKNYIEKYIFNNENNPLKFIIDFDYNFLDDEEIECSLTIDKDEDTQRNYLFDEIDKNGDLLTIEKEASSQIDLTCNQTLEDVELRLYDIDDTLFKIKEYNETDSIAYTIDPFSCIGDNKCNYYQSINALLVYGTSLDDSTQIDNYLKNLISESNNEEYVYYNDEILDTSRYLYYLRDEELIAYLKFKQNNDGSWGDGTSTNRIEKTSWSVLGLEKATSTSEYIEDGKKWIYYNEPTNGWGNIEKNVLAYLAIKEKLKPYVKIDSKNQISKTTYFKIENPTIYDLKDIKISFTKDINQYLSYKENVGNLNGQEDITFNVTLSDNFFGVKSGEITVTGLDGKNKEMILIKLPINIVGSGLLSIKSYDYGVSENNKNIELEVETDLKEFNYVCNFLNPFTNSNVKVSITHTNKLFKIENPNLEEGEFKVDMNCKYQDQSFEMPIEFNVFKTTKTIELPKTTHTINSENDFSLEIHNIDTDKQTVQISVEGDYSGIIEPTEKSKILARNETREVYFTIKNPFYLEALGETNNSYAVIKAQNGYVEKIALSYSTIEQGGDKEENSNLIWYIIIVIVVLSLLGLLVLKRYKELKEEQEEENQDEDEMYFDDLEFE